MTDEIRIYPESVLIQAVKFVCDLTYAGETPIQNIVEQADVFYEKYRERIDLDHTLTEDQIVMYREKFSQSYWEPGFYEGIDAVSNYFRVRQGDNTIHCVEVRQLTPSEKGET